jgi:DnaJ-class molecular chaperone
MENAMNPPPDTPDYYADLGVSQNASMRTIRLSFMRLARDTHPDKKVGESNDAADFRKVGC